MGDKTGDATRRSLQLTGSREMRVATVAADGRSSVCSTLGACLCAVLRVYTEQRKHLSITA